MSTEMKSADRETNYKIGKYLQIVLDTDASYDERRKKNYELGDLASQGYITAVQALIAAIRTLKDEENYFFRLQVLEALADSEQIAAIAGLRAAFEEDSNEEVRIKALTKVTVKASSIHSDPIFREVSETEALQMIELAKKDRSISVRDRAYECLQSIMEYRSWARKQQLP